jgi:diguanylate cyclase (GGDEF)-like protein
MTRRLRPFAAATLAALAFLHAGARAADTGATMDDLVRIGEDHPEKAIESLNRLAGSGAIETAADRRVLLRSIGTIAARNGWEAEARARIEALRTMSQPPDELALADADLVAAELEDTAGHIEASYERARVALAVYASACEPGPKERADCDYRARWGALDIALKGATGQGNVVVAANLAQSMLDIARRAGDRPREALSLASSAQVAEANADPAAANRLIAQALRLARIDGAPWLEVSVAVADARIHRRRQQYEATERDYLDALKLARQAGLERLELLVRTNLSDVYLIENRPAEALAAINVALPMAHRHRNLRKERVLLHNATLAHLALGHVAEAKRELPRVLDLWQRDTGPGEQADALREFGDALERAGDTLGAIDLFHREEQLRSRILEANKAAAEADMHARYDLEAQQRRIELLERDNQLKTADLENKALGRRLWMFGGLAMALLGALAMLAYRRMREVNRALVRHEALLRAHSERDALTGLANRRQFREVMRVRGGNDFRGALLMVDVDHFKRINDHHGHVAGDRVLVEVARRLAAAVRGADLVARWGGEEFLVFAPGVEGRELEQLAERVRTAIEQVPVALDGGQALAATVSIGYAAFPLPAGNVPVTWEQAVNLADLSLYTAKHSGRNCAVGIVGTTAASPDALREVEADLARAQLEGRVTLKVTPAARAPVAALP